KGFSAVIVLLILILIAVIGFTGYYVWNTQKSKNKQTTQNGQTNIETSEAANSQEQTEAAKPADTQKYLVIKEWGVKIPIDTSQGGGLVYTIIDHYIDDVNSPLPTGQENALLSSKDIIATTPICNNMYLITRSDKELSTDGPSPSVLLAKIGNFYYYGIPSQSYCGSNNQTEEQITKAGDIQTSVRKSYIESAPSIVAQ
ncbi:MAG: hypothetical protein QG562_612, partial [Patescibacteria group bacterium]|nr:hypothetical protein [Patescibacteria group bacterium]